MRYRLELAALAAAGVLVGGCHARIVHTYRSPTIIISSWIGGRYYAGRAEVSQLSILLSVIYASYLPLIQHWLMSGLLTMIKRGR
jgi:hypothetical protein